MSKASRKVLIVDDESNIRSALGRVLHGYQLFFASQPSEALAILEKEKIDLIISDHLMPSLSGREFLKIVRGRFPDTLRMMLTGHADVQTAMEATNQGEIYRFLIKPWDDLALKLEIYFAFEHLEQLRSTRRFVEEMSATLPHAGTLGAAPGTGDPFDVTAE